MPCQVYSVVDLDEFEEEAESADAQHQTAALKIIASILNNAGVTYGLMGGMNFYLRGSGRTTQDVDLAVGRSNSLSAVLDLLNNERSPGSRMLWASGVARIFVRVRNQLVQLDLKSQGAEGHGMPTYAAQVRQIADRINYEKRRDFVSEVVQRNREDEEIVRWALKIERTPSPEPRPSTNGGRGGGGHTSRNSRDSRESRDSRDSRESTSRTYNDRERRSTTTTTPSSRNPASTRASDTLVSGMQRMRVSVDPSRSRVETRPAVSRVSRQPATEVRRSRRSDREPEYY
ncbi:hypothetical protein F5144DRAFT_594885 [Chaetomium tenue]|uniref:Uncharacterized protein n=1 Tax=Chaetomium tenue TaxID=1854479 RepID=A0ACB7NW37_9PEZI|nr:hypothetical protein F5144DRAFT_594885 [Chaetomium globosum]